MDDNIWTIYKSNIVGISFYFDFQYLKYSADKGFFFKNIYDLEGITLSKISNQPSFDKIYEDSEEKSSSQYNTINFYFGVNKSGYDYYFRQFQKVQELLAEISSVINIVYIIEKKYLF